MTTWDWLEHVFDQATKIGGIFLEIANPTIPADGMLHLLQSQDEIHKLLL